MSRVLAAAGQMGAGTGAGLAGVGPSGRGFGVAVAPGADARTHCYTSFYWNDLSTSSRSLVNRWRTASPAVCACVRRRSDWRTADDGARLAVAFPGQSVRLAMLRVAVAVGSDPAPVMLSGTDDERTALSFDAPTRTRMAQKWPRE